MLESSIEILERLSRTKSSGPKQSWRPNDCGEIDIVIRANGDWYHEGEKINRMSLVKLFASILMREGDRHCLCTPVERFWIQVEDAPFVVQHYEWHHSNGMRTLFLTTTLGDVAALDRPDALRMMPADNQSWVPYVEVREGLMAKVPRSMFYQWLNEASESENEGVISCCIESGGHVFILGRVTADEGGQE